MVFIKESIENVNSEKISKHIKRFQNYPACKTKNYFIYLLNLLGWATIQTKLSTCWSHLRFWERRGSVVECLTRDRRAAGLSLTGVTALWSLSKTYLS